MSARMNRGARMATLAVASLTLAGCALVRVDSYAERGFDVRQYRTYTWGPPDTWSTGDPRLDNNRFFDERVRMRVEEELKRRGFEKVTTGHADLTVHYHINVAQEVDIRTLDRETSYCPDNECQPVVYEKGTLFVDLVEPRRARLIWRGWVEGSIDRVVDNQALMESRIDTAVAKILARLPNRL